MTIMMMHKEEDIEITYENVQSVLTIGAISTKDGNVPVFQLHFPDCSTATFPKAEWDMFMLKKSR